MKFLKNLKTNFTVILTRDELKNIEGGFETPNSVVAKCFCGEKQVCQESKKCATRSKEGSAGLIEYQCDEGDWQDC